MMSFVLFGLSVLTSLSVGAQELTIVLGSHPEKTVTAAQVASQVRPGQILLMGESHGVHSAQYAQMQLLNALRDRGLKVSTGLEFFYYPDQALVSAYRKGVLAESDFLSRIQWGKPGFEFYRPQAQFPNLAAGEFTIAINAPRMLTGKISKEGLPALTDAERALMPPDFAMGRSSYKRRFLEVMAPHLPSPEAGENYFAAQSVWDDTMAWKATEFIKSHPDQVLVITVGDFHVQYKDGFPARVFARSGLNPIVFSFVNRAGLTPEELRQEILPSPVDGPRADFIWIADEPYFKAVH